jgi:RNA polymerase sigma-B factor
MGVEDGPHSSVDPGHRRVPPGGSSARFGITEQFAPLFEELHRLEPGDPRRARIREQLITGHLPIARRIAHGHSRHGDPQELEQVAALALVEAVDRFTPGRGTPFIAFAAPTIRGGISHHHRDREPMIRAPRAVHELRGRAAVVSADLAQLLGRTPTAAEVAERLGTDRTTAAEALGAGPVGSCDSLDRPGGPGGSSGPLARPDERFDLVEDRLHLRSLVGRLSERDRRILLLRFHGGLTQSQIGARVGLTQMGVSRVLKSALATLRTAATAQGAGTG